MKSPFVSVIPRPALPPTTPFGNINRYVDAIRSPPPGGGGTLTFPFQLQDVSDPEPSPVAKINVRYGTLQDNEPTDVATDITLLSGTTYFYLDLEVDIDGVFVAASLIADLSPQPADSDYHGYITLGNAVSDGAAISVINQAATHSLRFAMCGRVVTDGVLTAPGTYEFWGF